MRLAESELEQELSDEASDILEDNNTEMELPEEGINEDDLNTGERSCHRDANIYEDINSLLSLTYRFRLKLP